jgi:hypothetical protein
MVFEEQLIGFIDPLANILHGLRTDKLPERISFPQLGNVLLQLRAVQMLSKHSVVTFMQSDAVVIDYPCRIDRTLQIPIALVKVELELVRFHAIYDNMNCR